MNALDPLGLGLVLALWAVVGFGLWMQRARSPFHMATIALVVTGLIGSFFPLATSFIEPSSWRNLDVISPATVRASQLQYVAYALGLALALVATGTRKSATLPRCEPPDTTARDFTASALLVGTGLTMYAIYANRVGLSALTDREDYAAKYLASQGLGPLQLGLPIGAAQGAGRQTAQVEDGLELQREVAGRERDLQPLRPALLQGGQGTGVAAQVEHVDAVAALALGDVAGRIGAVHRVGG